MENRGERTDSGTAVEGPVGEELWTLEDIGESFEFTVTVMYTWSVTVNVDLSQTPERVAVGRELLLSEFSPEAEAVIEGSGYA